MTMIHSLRERVRRRVVETVRRARRALVRVQYALDGAFRYESGDVPARYVCGACGAAGCKLWREYQTFLDHQVLRCVDCALESQKECLEKRLNPARNEIPLTDAERRHVDESGRRLLYKFTQDGVVHEQRSDQIGWLVPAIPTEENDTFWGYSSVPEEGVAWWRGLPLRVELGPQNLGPVKT